MKVYELHAREGLDAVTRTERPTPKVGPGQARVRVRAASLNYRDLVIARGSAKRSRPIIPLSDGAGEVVEVGAGVTEVAVGDRVAGSFFPTWIDGELSDEHHAAALGGGWDGMLAEEVVLPASAWVKLPEHLSFEEGATLPCAALTAYHALYEAGRLRPGDTVLVQGTGGVSIFALQMAKASGARVVLTTSTEAKADRARSLGADHVLLYPTTPNWGEQARAWTGGRGVDIAVEVGGAGTFDQSALSLRYGGTMGLIGVLTGTKGTLNTYTLIHRSLHVAGIYVGSVAMFEAMNRALSASKIHPIVDRVFAFDEARAAYEHMASGQHFGKVVIRVD